MGDRAKLKSPGLLVQLMQAQEVSVRGLARETGVTPAAISLLRAGALPPRVDGKPRQEMDGCRPALATAIETALGVKPGTLFDLTSTGSGRDG